MDARDRAPVAVARLFNTAGARQRADAWHGGAAVRRTSALGRRLQVLGDGPQTRCFAHVLDVVAALHVARGLPVAAGEVFNVGTQDEVTVLELAER